MLMANNGCSRHRCSQWSLISSLSFSSLPLKANQQHMPYMRMVTCDDICAHIKCMKIWIAKHGLLHNAQEDDDTHWIPANHGEAKGALMPEKLMPGARWPKVHLLCQVAKGWWLQQNQSLKGMFYNELFFNCEKRRLQSPEHWAAHLMLVFITNLPKLTSGINAATLLQVEKL